MRKLFLLALLAIVATLGVAAAPASAGGCNSFIGNQVSYDGTWTWQGQAWGCSGINGVQFSTPSEDWTGISDFTHGVFHNVFQGGGWANGQTANYYTQYHNYVWGIGCGYPPFWAGEAFSYRIRQTAGNTVGPWHQYRGSGFYLC